MRFDILTLFPGFFESPLNESIIKRAIAEKKIEVGLHNIRDYTHDRHRVVDDAPYGGGSGMVMKPEPVVECIEKVRKEKSHVILLAPQGERFSQKKARELCEKKHIVMLCGRYEGIDERVNQYTDEAISIGDFVLTGGEPAAFMIIDAVSRLLPGVLGCENSMEEESFSWDILEYPQYTRPPAFRGMPVPEPLLSGNHELIRRWRRKEAIRKTIKNRPDLLENAALTDEDRRLIEEIEKEEKHVR